MRICIQEINGWHPPVTRLFLMAFHVSMSPASLSLCQILFNFSRTVHTKYYNTCAHLLGFHHDVYQLLCWGVVYKIYMQF